MILHSGFRLVDIADDVVRTIERFSRPNENSREAGGILLGSYRGPHIEIVACTTPLPRDRRRWNLFDRRDPGHSAEAVKRWQDSGRTVTFVGEWHTHPEPIPSPSFIDKNTWRLVSRRNKAGPTVFGIRGTTSWWFGMWHNGKLMTLAQLDTGTENFLAPTQT
jgi:integrative and conjugative element protein (TIGR02256 family)